MNSIVIASIVFTSALVGALAGLVLQRVLPAKYLEHDTKEIVRLGTGLIATMAALVLGLLVSAAKSSFDEETSGFNDLALDIVLLDRTLAQYGADAASARDHVKSTAAQTIASLWPDDPAESARIDDAKITAEGSALMEALRHLSPHDDMQQTLKAQALTLSGQLMRDRWRLSQSGDSSLPTPFLVVLAFWLFVLFGSFGLFSPRNALAVFAMLVCAASVAGAVFLIVDLDQPFDGWVKISSAALRDAYHKLGN